MKIERIAWLLLVSILTAALAMTYNAYSSLKHSFLANKLEEGYVSATLTILSKQEGLNVNKEALSKDFYIAYVGMSDRSCVRLVPKRHVTGGANTYCFAKKVVPVKLLSIDREAE